MNPSQRDLFTRIGALYVSLVESEESKGKLVEELADCADRNSNMSARFGNALAHLEIQGAWLPGFFLHRLPFLLSCHCAGPPPQ